MISLEENNMISPELESIEEERMENSLRPKVLEEYIRANKSKRKYENIYRGCQKKRRAS